MIQNHQLTVQFVTLIIEKTQCYLPLLGRYDPLWKIMHVLTKIIQVVALVIFLPAAMDLIAVNTTGRQNNVEFSGMELVVTLFTKASFFIHAVLNAVVTHIALRANANNQAKHQANHQTNYQANH